jgi:hypothetical protein
MILPTSRARLFIYHRRWISLLFDEVSLLLPVYGAQVQRYLCLLPGCVVGVSANHGIQSSHSQILRIICTRSHLLDCPFTKLSWVRESLAFKLNFMEVFGSSFCPGIDYYKEYSRYYPQFLMKIGHDRLCSWTSQLGIYKSAYHSILLNLRSWYGVVKSIRNEE